MFESQTPTWIRFVEKKCQWIAIPNLAVIIVTLQALGFVFVLMDPVWGMRLALIPQLVVMGEYWRVITFLALPLSTSPIWGIFSLWFLYFVINSIESRWGAVRTTLYVLISILLMVGFSFTFSYPITDISGFESTLFLAAASLFPDMQILLFFVMPVKMLWLAWFTLAMLVFKFFSSSWLDRLYLLAIYANYFLFFGPALFYSVKQSYRRWDYKKKMRN